MRNLHFLVVLQCVLQQLSHMSLEGADDSIGGEK